MLLCMRTTVDIEDHLLREAKVLAAQTGGSVRALIEEGLRRVLDARRSGRTEDLPPLPTHKGGGVQPGVDLSDKKQLLDIMDGVE